MQTSIVTLGPNARCRMRKVNASPSPPFVRKSSSLFAGVTARHTATHALQQLPVFPSNMKGSARSPGRKPAAELPVSPALKARPVWMIPRMIAIPHGAVRIARESARVKNSSNGNTG
jgi:hypothetical protein